MDNNRSDKDFTDKKKTRYEEAKFKGVKQAEKEFEEALKEGMMRYEKALKNLKNR